MTSLRRWPFALLVALAVCACALYAYRELFARPFAADDYQWLLNVRDLSAAQLARAAFDPAAQTHFYRPLVWLIFWLQVRAFDLDPRGFHAVSLALHLLNAALAGWFAWRIAGERRPTLRQARGRPNDEQRTTNDDQQSGRFARLAGALVAGALVALHPAPFEAIVWVSAQSELLAAALLLAALHLWLGRAITDERRTTNGEGGQESIDRQRLVLGGQWSVVSGHVVLATLALALALLAKESAVIGLPLLALFGWGVRPPAAAGGWRRWLQPLALPALLTGAYLALQVAVERRNYLLQAGGYGLGPQIILNPLRSLALLVAPLTGTEHADNTWLVPVGAILTLALLAALAWCAWHGGRLPVALQLALALTLLPTAPFTSPPDSRYLYLPLIMAALIVALVISRVPIGRVAALPARVALGVGALALALALAGWASNELHLREWRFSAGAGPGGSLWQLATQVCAQGRPERMVIVEPPLATPHAEAIIGLACGPDVRALVVGRDQVAKSLRGHSVVVAFPNGSAAVERTT